MKIDSEANPWTDRLTVLNLKERKQKEKKKTIRSCDKTTSMLTIKIPSS